MLELRQWWQWQVSGRAAETAARERLLQVLAGDPGRWYAQSFARARQGLRAYLEHLGPRDGRDTVLLSAQACPVLACTVKDAGFRVRFVDTDAVYPSPTLCQYAEAVDRKTAAIVVAPLYGYMPSDWRCPTSWVDEVPLVLDLAQGLLLREQMGELFQRADAVMYSFGLGKGLDTGGGLLLTRRRLPPHARRRSPRAHYHGILVKSVTLRVLSRVGASHLLVKYAESSVVASQCPSRTAPVRAPDDIYTLWSGRLEAFRSDVELARDRAGALASMSVLGERCLHLEAFCSSTASHLRQVLRLRDGHARDRSVSSLRKLGIDCAPAGEPLPSEYGEDRGCECFPNGTAFRNDAIRLPFLGRLSDRQFGHLKVSLERALG